MDVAEFLEARLAEDEAWARETEADRERDAEFGRITVHRWLPAGLGKTYHDPWPLPGEPKLVLREVAAKRAIIEAAEEASGLDMSVDVDRRVGGRDMVEEPYVGDVILRALAAVYANHPDFIEEWRP